MLKNGFQTYGKQIVQNQNLYKYNGKELQTDFDLDWYDYGARFYDVQLGRFTGIDPIAEKFYHVTVYNYAENRPVSGIDLWGLQYLDHNKARIIAQNGHVRIKKANLHNVTRNRINAMNSNPREWKSGEIGVNTTIGKVDRRVFSPDKAKSARLSNNANDPSHRSSDIKTEGSNRSAKRLNEKQGAPVVSGRSSGGKGGAGAVLAINAINYGLEMAGGFMVAHDKSLIEEHSSGEILGSALQDINTAISEGMIPDEYNNVESLTDILNVVLQGENTTDNQDIMDLGVRILQEVSKNYNEEMIKKEE